MIKEIKKDISFIRNHKLQPKWFKILKVFLLLSVVVLFMFILGIIESIIWFLSFLFLGVMIHVLYRKKTSVFTKSWMDFRVIKKDEGLEYKRIGIVYYSLVFLAFGVSLVLVLLFLH